MLLGVSSAALYAHELLTNIDVTTGRGCTDPLDKHPVLTDGVDVEPDTSIAATCPCNTVISPFIVPRVLRIAS